MSNALDGKELACSRSCPQEVGLAVPSIVNEDFAQLSLKKSLNESWSLRSQFLRIEPTSSASTSRVREMDSGDCPL